MKEVDDFDCIPDEFDCLNLVNSKSSDGTLARCIVLSAVTVAVVLFSAYLNFENVVEFKSIEGLSVYMPLGYLIVAFLIVSIVLAGMFCFIFLYFKNEDLARKRELYNKKYIEPEFDAFCKEHGIKRPDFIRPKK